MEQVSSESARTVTFENYRFAKLFTLDQYQILADVEEEERNGEKILCLVVRCRLNSGTKELRIHGSLVYIWARFLNYDAESAKEHLAVIKALHRKSRSSSSVVLM